MKHRAAKTAYRAVLLAQPLGESLVCLADQLGEAPPATINTLRQKRVRWPDYRRPGSSVF